MKLNDTGLDWDPREVRKAFSVEVRSCVNSVLDIRDVSQFSRFEGLYPPGSVKLVSSIVSEIVKFKSKSVLLVTSCKGLP
jgi:hypothetical protein